MGERAARNRRPTPAAAAQCTGLGPQRSRRAVHHSTSISSRGNLLPHLGETFLQIPPPGRGLERGDHLPETRQLEDQELLVALRRVDAERRQAAEIRLPIQRVLDGVSGRVVLGGDAGTPPLDRGRQERQAPAVVRAKLGEGFGESGAGTPRDRSAQSLPCHADRRYRLVASNNSPAMIEPGPP